MRNHTFVLLFLTIASFIACSNIKPESPGATAPSEYQAISVRGDTLYAPPMDEKKKQTYEAELKKAEEAYSNQPQNAEAALEYGKYATALGLYRKAIAIYSEGIERHPEETQLYSRRGQAYVVARRFGEAVADLEKAVSLLNTTKKNSSSMMQTDPQYQLGIAQYLNGDFKSAAQSLQQSLHKTSGNNMRVKVSYWLYMSLRRAGMDLEAGNVLDPINDEMNLTEHQVYKKLLLVFKGDFNEQSLLDDSYSPEDNATISYGLANWHYINGREGRARELFKTACEGNNWDDIGYIAAEVDLNRLDLNSK